MEEERGVVSALALGGGGVDAVVDVVREGEDGEKEEVEMGDLMLDGGFFSVDDSHEAPLFPWPLLLMLPTPRIPSVVSRCCCCCCCCRIRC